MAGHTDLAEAIADAEGFGVAGAIPTVAHNPGDLVLGDRGFGTLGAEHITVFQDDATGWAALEHELTLIRTGKSHVYEPSMTIGQMAVKWTDTQVGAWAQNVCDALVHMGHYGVTTNTKLRDVL